MAASPGVSVIVASRNASSTIGRAVKSALAQAEVQELFVVDDASTDATAHIAAAADDGSGRLSLIRASENRGPAAARNLALARAQAEFICVLDADDWMQEGRLRRVLTRAGSEDWDMFADDLLRATEAAPDTPTGTMLGIPQGARRTIDLVGFIAGNLDAPRNARRELGYLKPLLRRSFLDRANLRYDERLRLGEDYTLYAHALLRGARFGLTQACGYVAVERANSLSRRHGATELAELLAADDRLIEEAGRLAPEALPILEKHRRGVSHKLAHRRTLDARRQGDWLAALSHLFSSPSAAAHILGQTLRAKLPAAR